MQLQGLFRGALLVGALFSSSAFAHHECGEGEDIIGFAVGSKTDITCSAGCAAIADDFNEASEVYVYTPHVNGSFTHTTYEVCTVTRDDAGNTEVFGGECIPICGPPEDPCEATAGAEVMGSWTDAGHGSTICGTNSSELSCNWTFSGVGVAFGGSNDSYYGKWTQGAESCEEPHDSVHADEDGDQNCAEVGGETRCFSNDGQNCGELNGVRVCLGDAPDGACTFFGDGSAVCDASADTPPAPDNGTPGDPAVPDMSVVDPTGHEGDQTDYFDTGTVAGSTGEEGGDDGGPEGDHDNCEAGVDCPGEWVDREYNPGEPGDYESFHVPTGAELTPLLPTVDYSGEHGTWRDFFVNTFPFSLLAGPLTAISSSTDSPSFSWHPEGVGAVTLDLSAWDPVAEKVRWGVGLLMIFGWWTLVMSTIWRSL